MKSYTPIFWYYKAGDWFGQTDNPTPTSMYFSYCFQQYDILYALNETLNQKIYIYNLYITSKKEKKN